VRKFSEASSYYTLDEKGNETLVGTDLFKVCEKMGYQFKRYIHPGEMKDHQEKEEETYQYAPGTPKIGNPCRKKLLHLLEIRGRDYLLPRTPTPSRLVDSR
jgi:hypothetical protein